MPSYILPRKNSPVTLCNRIPRPLQLLNHFHTAYGAVRRRRTLHMLNYMLLTVVVNGYNCVAVRHRRQRNACILRPSTYHERSVCVNAAAEINVLDYSVVVRQRTAWRTAPYVVWTGFKSRVQQVVSISISSYSDTGRRKFNKLKAELRERYNELKQSLNVCVNFVIFVETLRRTINYYSVLIDICVTITYVSLQSKTWLCK